jgi:hypothetical protein
MKDYRVETYNARMQMETAKYLDKELSGSRTISLSRISFRGEFLSRDSRSDGNDSTFTFNFVSRKSVSSLQAIIFLIGMPIPFNSLFQREMDR